MKKSISKYIKQIRGVSYKPSDLHEILDENSIVLLRANNIKDGQINFDDVVYVDRKRVSPDQILQKGDVLICASSGSANLVGKAAQYLDSIECTFGAFCKVARPKEDMNKYIGLFFQSPFYRRKISHLANGANINNIKNEHIDSFEISILSKEDEIKFISKMESMISILRKKQIQIDLLDNLVKSRFVELLNDSEKEVRLDDLISPYKAEKCGNNTYPVLSITMRNGLMLQSDRFKKEIASGDKSQYKVVPRNKLVVAFPIDEGLLSAQTIVDAGIVSPAYNLYSIDESKVMPKVLEYILRSNKSIQYYLSKLRGTTLRRRMIPKEDFYSMPIQLPTIDRQKQFLSEVNQVDKSKFIYDFNIKRYTFYVIVLHYFD